MQSFTYTIPEGKTTDEIVMKLKGLFNEAGNEIGDHVGTLKKEGLVGSYEFGTGTIEFRIEKLPSFVPFQYVEELITNMLSK